MRIPKTKKPAMAETGKIELNIRVPNLSHGALVHIVRDVRRALEACADLNLLTEFVETRMVEYTEIPAEGPQ